MKTQTNFSIGVFELTIIVRNSSFNKKERGKGGIINGFNISA